MEDIKYKKYSGELDASFWNLRWQTGRTGWDVGYASTPLVEYMKQYENKDAAILIPGCGNAYEAEFLAEQGFTDITLLDIAEEAVMRLEAKFKHNPAITVLNGDFFMHEGKYDLIIEQTFFCAQVLQRRADYVEKAYHLLKDGGKLVGVLFNADFGITGPPFGGNKKEYEEVFEPYFNIHTMTDCYNSIAPRMGSELFVILERK